MTPPRQVLPGTTIEITQRTLDRAFRFLPEAKVRQLVLYVLGVSAQRYEITLFGFVLMVTHYHLVILDRLGRMPEFAQYLNSLIARGMNCLQGRRDKLWSGRGYCAVRPQSAADVMSKIVYGLANPSDADLVNRVEDYPGVIITPDQIGVDLVVERPDWFFRESGTMPERITLRFEMPPEFEHLGLEGYRRKLWEEVRQREAEARAERRSQGLTVVGERRLRQASLGQRSQSWEQWFGLRPEVAAKLRADRVAAIQALKAFRQSYREALAAWRGGNRGALFPPGTWWMCRFAGAAVG